MGGRRPPGASHHLHGRRSRRLSTPGGRVAAQGVPRAGVHVVRFTEPDARTAARAAVLQSPRAPSQQLTVGTVDANGQPPAFAGSVRHGARPGDPATTPDEADVSIAVTRSTCGAVPTSGTTPVSWACGCRCGSPTATTAAPLQQGRGRCRTRHSTSRCSALRRQGRPAPPARSRRRPMRSRPARYARASERSGPPTGCR